MRKIKSLTAAIAAAAVGMGLFMAPVSSAYALSNYQNESSFGCLFFGPSPSSAQKTSGKKLKANLQKAMTSSAYAKTSYSILKNTSKKLITVTVKPNVPKKYPANFADATNRVSGNLILLTGVVVGNKELGGTSPMLWSNNTDFITFSAAELGSNKKAVTATLKSKYDGTLYSYKTAAKFNKHITSPESAGSPFDGCETKFNRLGTVSIPKGYSLKIVCKG